MAEYPILFSAPMVLDGRKTQTRRIVCLRAWAIFEAEYAARVVAIERAA